MGGHWNSQILEVDVYNSTTTVYNNVTVYQKYKNSNCIVRYIANRIENLFTLEFIHACS